VIEASGISGKPLNHQRTRRDITDYSLQQLVISEQFLLFSFLNFFLFMNLNQMPLLNYFSRCAQKQVLFEMPKF
jgi:hypothetical protein